MEKLVELTPAFDQRNADPNKNYGIHGVTLRMVLKGELGAYQFVLYTNWQLPHVTEEMRANMTPDNHFLYEPMAADLGYHALNPQYEGQAAQDDCEYLDGKPCYYDGSGLQAQSVYDTLLTEGSDGVWTILEGRYADRFGELR